MVEVLEGGDYALIAIYFFVVLLVGLWSTFRPNKDSAAGYFLAGKDMHWFPVGSSIFASNVGAPMFIGLAGTAAAGGIACAIYEWHAIFLLILLGWVFVPVYVASGAFTMPEYLKKRFGGKRLRITLTVLALILYVLTKLSAEIYSGAIFLQQLLGWNMYLCVVIILGVTAIYTVAGGLAAVIYTDTLQTIILIIGATILFILSMVDIGGWEAMLRKYTFAASNLTKLNTSRYGCGLPRDDFMHIWRDPVDGDIPWTGSVFGLTVLGLWVWCQDQIMVQRCLSAKNISHSKAGCTLAASLKILPFFLWIIPGMISRIFYPDEVACADPDQCEKACGNKAGCSNIAYPLLVLRKMPSGLRGLMLAALLAALMSSLTSIFNSASSMFTMDLWRRFRRRATESELMIVGRMTVIGLVGLTVLWIPIMQQSQGGQLWSYLQAISSYTAPPWCVVFLMALFWKRTTEPAAFWGLVIGLGVGFIRMVIDFTFPAPFCGSTDPDERPAVLADVHFLHFAIILTWTTVFCIVVISFFTKPMPPEKLRKVTWWTRNDELEPEQSDSDDEIPQEDERKPRRIVKKTVGRRFYMWLCGVSDTPKPKLSKEELAIIRKKMTSLAENPKTKRILDIVAILVGTVTAFLLAFFA